MKNANNNSNNNTAGMVALCGVLAALAMVIMLIGGLIPIGTYVCPMLASIVLIPVLYEYGTIPALCLYAVISFLSLLMAPDKEAAFIMTFLGWYPAIREHLDRIKPLFLSIFVKLICFSIPTFTAYYLMIAVFGIGSITEEFNTFSNIFLIILIITGAITFILYDLMLRRVTIYYRLKLRNRIWRRKK